MRIISIGLIGLALMSGAACENWSKRMTAEELQTFKEKQQAELEQDRRELEEKRSIEGASADKKLSKFEERLTEERAEAETKHDRRVEGYRERMEKRPQPPIGGPRATAPL